MDNLLSKNILRTPYSETKTLISYGRELFSTFAETEDTTSWDVTTSYVSSWSSSWETSNNTELNTDFISYVPRTTFYDTTWSNSYIATTTNDTTNTYYVQQTTYWNTGSTTSNITSKNTTRYSSGSSTGSISGNVGDTFGTISLNSIYIFGDTFGPFSGSFSGTETSSGAYGTFSCSGQGVTLSGSWSNDGSGNLSFSGSWSSSTASGSISGSNTSSYSSSLQWNASGNETYSTSYYAYYTTSWNTNGSTTYPVNTSYQTMYATDWNVSTSQQTSASTNYSYTVTTSYIGTTSWDTTKTTSQGTEYTYTTTKNTIKTTQWDTLFSTSDPFMKAVYGYNTSLNILIIGDNSTANSIVGYNFPGAPYVYELDSNNEFVVSTSPSVNSTSTGTDGNFNGYLGKRLLSKSSTFGQVNIANISTEDTSIGMWLKTPTETPPVDLYSKILEAKNALERIDLIIFSINKTDITNSTTSVSYKNNLDQLHTDLITDGIESVYVFNVYEDEDITTAIEEFIDNSPDTFIKGVDYTTYELSSDVVDGEIQSDSVNVVVEDLSNIITNFYKGQL